jgi:hypothetical protein
MVMFDMVFLLWFSLRHLGMPEPAEAGTTGTKKVACEF